jgi:CreA protein
MMIRVAVFACVALIIATSGVVNAFDALACMKHRSNHMHSRTNHFVALSSQSDEVEQTTSSEIRYQSKRAEVRKAPSLVGQIFAVLTVVASLHLPLVSATSVANAADSKVVGSFSGSGLFFKDTLQVEAFDDPKVQGVKLYVSNFILPLNERLSSTKNLFSDPSSASLTCAKNGPIKVADTIVKGTSGEQVFEESKSLLFKSLKVQRIYDEDDKTLIYVSYNTRLDKNDDSNKSRFKSSLCAIGLE